MPHVDIKLIEGGVTFVVVDEVKSGDWVSAARR
jgi:phenylpyruvate tautomerase PptA (4-oxalocrotonate tautomerase family)